MYSTQYDIIIIRHVGMLIFDLKVVSFLSVNYNEDQ